ncbi:MAG: ATP-binding protein [bacterium]
MKSILMLKVKGRGETIGSKWSKIMIEEEADDENGDPNLGYYESKLNWILNEAKQKGVKIPVEELCAEHELSEQEKAILIILYFATLSGRTLSGVELLRLISSEISGQLRNMALILPGGRLIKLGLITTVRDFPEEGANRFFGVEFTLTADTFLRISGLENLAEKSEVSAMGKMRRDGGERCELLKITEPEISLDMLVLAPGIKNSLELALWRYEHGDEALQRYGVAERFLSGRGTTMLFFGPPGTGKTATAEAVARVLNRKLGYASYHQILSRWFGESERNIVRVFDEARGAGCVLLFDEADALFGVRLAERYAGDRSYNQMTNILMQEVERFDGLMILTTNRDFAFDPAFERRILLRLKFELPDERMREEIWRLFLKGCDKLNDDVSFSELARRYPMTGGKIKNAVLKAVLLCARKGSLITMADLESAARDELGEKQARTVGF